jgi:hypothetical protein
MKKSMFLVLVMILSCILVYAQEAVEDTSYVVGDQIKIDQEVAVEQVRAELRQAIVNVARGELGYHETGDNITKYGAWYGLQGQPWCAMFVSWCANQAGVPTSAIVKYAGCTTGCKWFKNQGVFKLRTSGYRPQTGDLIFFSKNNGAECYHTGIVEYTDGSVHTIEGNSSDMVTRRTYDFNKSTIYGYAVPAYPRCALEEEVENTAFINGLQLDTRNVEETVVTSSRSSMRDDIVAVAEKEIGYKETGNNITKYGKWYGCDGEPWCAMFVSWCANKAGIPRSVIVKYAGCTSGRRWFMNNSVYKKRTSGYTPRKGDLIFFTDDGGNSCCHTGIVTSVSGGKVNTIEGNTSNKVARRSYDLNSSRIDGYAVPQYPKCESEETEDTSFINGLQLDTRATESAKLSASSTRGLRDTIVSVAENEIGYAETGNNYTKYGKWYGCDGQPWCAMFVSWCANKAGVSTGIICKYAGCTTGRRWFVNAGVYKKRSSGYTPRKGDLIFFTDDGGSSCCHTGIVTSVSGGKVNTIEGNTSDKVARRSYDLGKTRIDGYASPNY